jgi:predicted ester cyclase
MPAVAPPRRDRRDNRIDLPALETGDVHGIDAFRRARADFLPAFLDLRVRVEAIMADRDDVVIRWRASGSHGGDGWGVKATRQPVSFRGMTWHRYRAGRLVEGWDCRNHMVPVEQPRRADPGRREAGQNPIGSWPGELKITREPMWGRSA